MPGAAILVADSSTVTFMGVMVPPAPGPSLGGGSPVPQWDRCWGRGCDFWLSCLLLLCSGCCQLMAIWHLALLQPPLSYCSPSRAKLGMLCYVLPYLPFQKKTPVTGSPSVFLVPPGTLPPESISPLSLHRHCPQEGCWCWVFPTAWCPWQWLALLWAGMLPGKKPSMPAALKGSKAVQGCHSPAGYVLIKTHIVKIQGNS